MLQATEALLGPEEAITDNKDVIKKLVAFIEKRGGNVHFNSPVWSVNQTAAGEIIIQTAISNHTSDRLVSCSG
jgi:L-2-hydroxyglutarate oxidase LhgO